LLLTSVVGEDAAVVDDMGDDSVFVASEGETGEEEEEPIFLSSEYYDSPLELGDIMPKSRKHYDKMRPPKYKCKEIINLYNLK
jgi:hypothetical protein